MVLRIFFVTMMFKLDSSIRLLRVELVTKEIGACSFGRYWTLSCVQGFLTLVYFLPAILCEADLAPRLHTILRASYLSLSQLICLATFSKTLMQIY